MVASIRKLEEVSRIVYVCSNHKPPVKNLLDLVSADKKSGFEGLDPFVVKRIIPLDVAPHTLRCELVILCERLSANEIPKSTRPTPKNAKMTRKNSAQQKKHWYNSSTGHAGRSNFFPTEEMVRRYSNIRKPNHQEIDYQKRDSLYPPPLRGALYQGFEDESSYYHPEPREVYPNNGYSCRGEFDSRSSYSNRSLARNKDGDLTRYTDFRRDLEGALDDTAHYTPGNELTSRKLAYANALLEEGIRIASEVLDKDSTGYYGRQKYPLASNKYRF